MWAPRSTSMTPRRPWRSRRPQLASDEGQLIEIDAALKEVQSQKAKAISQFVADNQNKLAEASRKADEARQALAKATARLAHTKLYAPIDGVAQQAAVTTVGQVVTTEQLAVITPAEGSESWHRLCQSRSGGCRQDRRLPLHPFWRAAWKGRQDRVRRDRRGEAIAR
jgi:multidrug efflux pump subunit AcrA (membrane-fusion protein)